MTFLDRHVYAVMFVAGLAIFLGALALIGWVTDARGPSGWERACAERGGVVVPHTSEARGQHATYRCEGAR